MDSKTILAFGLMLLIYMFFLQPKPNAVRQPVATNSVEVQRPEIPVVTRGFSADASAVESALRAKDFFLKSQKVNVKINGLGEIQSAEFLKFKTAGGEANETFGFVEQPLQLSNLRVAGLAPKFEIESSDDRHLVLKARSEFFESRRAVEISDSNYQVIITDEIKNISPRSLTATYTTKMAHITARPKSSGCASSFGPQSDVQEFVYFVDGKASRTPLMKITDSAPLEKQEQMSWAGISHKYFFFGLIPMSASLKSVRVAASQLNSNDSKSDLKTMADLALTEKQIAPGESTAYQYSFYIGPKDLAELSNVQPDLTKAIDYGDWIGPIARFLLNILHLFYSLIPNYGVAIILLTVLVKMALYPLAKKSAISMKRLQMVQPRMKEIREKFKNDKNRINVETMKLYKEEKVNPVGGCLPLLIQMPVFFALYRVFYASIELRQAPFVGWIKDLSVNDPFFVTPILMTALMWYQQKLTPAPAVDDDNEAMKMQRSMMKWMPIMFGAMMIFLPAGLTLYFLVSSLITIFQTQYLNKKLHGHVGPMMGI